MFAKKKSLAKIAVQRTKKDAPLADEEADDDDYGPENGDDDDDEATPEVAVDKRLSFQHTSTSGLLKPGLQRENSVSTPSLDRLDVPGAKPMLRNNSLKYSGGSLHQESVASSAPKTFDHTYDDALLGLAAFGRKAEMRHKMLRMKLGDSVENASIRPDSRLKANSKSPSPSPSMSSLILVRRTQSVRVPSTKKEKKDEAEKELCKSPPIDIPSPTSPISLFKSKSFRIRRPKSPTSRRASSPGRRGSRGSSARPSSSLSVDVDSDVNTDDDASSSSFYEDDTPVFSTPPAVQSPGVHRLRKESVSKSRSMVSLASGPATPQRQQQVQPDGLLETPPPQLSASTTAIPATQARNRSYLHGSVGPTSLLGPQELEKCFPDRTVRVFVGTWNMNGNTPPRFLSDFLLPGNLDFIPDVLVVGTQETFPERTEWEVRLQDTLGPSHVLFHSASLGTLHQAIFLRRDLIWYCSVPESDAYNSRPGAQFKTKGAVGTAFLIFGTSLLFVNSHLTAHQENTRDRIRDLKKINAMLNLPKELPSRCAKHKDISEKFDCVFWSGDLNFRLEQSRDVVIREVKDGATLLDFDQLNYLREEQLIFRGYSESPIQFAPTYKYDVGSSEFDSSSKQRTPSYTDRILFKNHRATAVRALHYDSVQRVTTSDHKPVWGTWEVKVRPGKDSVQLAGGMFNRDVYLEGLKRRAEALQPVLRGKAAAAASNMCSLQ